MFQQNLANMEIVSKIHMNTFQQLLKALVEYFRLPGHLV